MSSLRLSDSPARRSSLMSCAMPATRRTASVASRMGKPVSRTQRTSASRGRTIRYSVVTVSPASRRGSIWPMVFRSSGWTRSDQWSTSPSTVSGGSPQMRWKAGLTYSSRRLAASTIQSTSAEFSANCRNRSSLGGQTGGGR